MSFQFDATNIDPTNKFDLVPAGHYVAEIEDAELKDTKKGTGQYINLKFNIIDGPFNGRKVFHRINVINQNPDAESIGQQQLSQLCHAINHLKLRSERDLIGRTCRIKVTISPGTNGYDDQNDIKAFEALPGNSAPKPPAQQAAATNKPW
jgi:hypothetical protein